MTPRPLALTRSIARVPSGSRSPRARLLVRVAGVACLGGFLACGGPDGERSSARGMNGGTRAAGGDSSGGTLEHVSVTIDGETFRLELAADVPRRSRGLMYRRQVEPGGGMLFVFPRPEPQAFWMGWCHVDIDVIYLDEMARVTAHHRMKAEPRQQPGETDAEYRERLPRYPSRLPAQFVIELAGGTLDRLEVAVGDTIAIDAAGLASIAR